MRVSNLVRLFVACIALPVSSGALGTTLVMDAAGKVSGATGVSIGGTLYDVTFADGTCGSVFFSGNQCGVGSLTFTTEASALLAAEALSQQVFVLGDLDANPTRATGCTWSQQCAFVIPYQVLDPNFFRAGVAINAIGSNSSFTSVFQTSTDTTLDAGSVFAVFMQRAAAVPEPSTWAMMLLGFAGIGESLRRQKIRLRAVRDAVRSAA